MRHVVLTYDRVRVRTEIFIDGASKGTAEPCSKKRVPQMVTFGKFQVGSFHGKLDDLVIAAGVWPAERINGHFAG
jgi:hypothetical protein